MKYMDHIYDLVIFFLILKSVFCNFSMFWYCLDSIVKALADCVIGAKENLDDNLLSSIRNGNTVTIPSLCLHLPITLDEQLSLSFMTK